MRKSVSLINMRILRCVSLLALNFSLVVAMPELTSDAGAAIVALKERTRRDSAAGKSNLTNTACGQWSEWISRSTPNSSFGREEEHFTPDDLQILCPSGMVNDFRCKDEKGEAKYNIINETSVDKTFVFNCYNMSATCDVLNSSSNSSGAKCPDYAIRIKCVCPTAVSTTQSPFSGNATNGSTATRTPTSGSGTGNGTSGSAAGSGTSDSGTGGGTSGSGTGSGTSGSGTGSGSSGSGTGSGTSGSGTGGGSSGSGTGGVTSGSADGSGTSGSVPGIGTGGNQSGRYDSFGGPSSADGNFSAGGTSMPWWLIPLVVSLVLFVVNLILVLCVYNKLKMQIGTNQVGPI